MCVGRNVDSNGVTAALPFGFAVVPLCFIKNSYPLFLVVLALNRLNYPLNKANGTFLLFISPYIVRK